MVKASRGGLDLWAAQANCRAPLSGSSLTPPTAAKISGFCRLGFSPTCDPIFAVVPLTLYLARRMVAMKKFADTLAELGCARRYTPDIVNVETETEIPFSMVKMVRQNLKAILHQR